MLAVKNLPANAADIRDVGLISGLGDPLDDLPGEDQALKPTPVLLPGESHGQRSLVGYSQQGCKESGTTEATQPA